MNHKSATPSESSRTPENALARRLEVQIAADLSAMLMEFIDEVDGFEPPISVEEIEIRRSDMPSAIAKELVTSKVILCNDSDSQSLRTIIDQTVENYLGNNPVEASIRTSQTYDELLAAVRKHIVDSRAGVGIHLIEPGWGIDDESNRKAALLTTDPEALAEMVNAILNGEMPDNGPVSAALIENLHLPVEIAAELARVWREGHDFGGMILSRADATAEILEEWSNFPGILELQDIANHPNANTKTLTKLAQSEHDCIAAAAFKNPNFPAGLIDSFERHPNDATRREVAIHTSSGDVLKRLAHDPALPIRWAVAQNERTPAEVHSLLALTDPEPLVVLAAARNLRDPVVLEELAKRLADRRDEQLRTAILQNPNSNALTKTIAALIA